MASAVLAKRYRAAPGKPPSTNQKSGAISESLRFSARVSIALSRTSVGVKTAVSRLTSRRSCSRPAARLSASALSTAATSSYSSRQANKGFSSTPRSAAVRRRYDRSQTRPAPSVRPQVRAASIRRQSMFDALLRRNSSRERMLDQTHLRDRIGDLDQLLRAPPAGNHHVHRGGTRGQHRDDGLQSQPTVNQRIGHFVENHQKMLAALNRLGR